MKFENYLNQEFTYHGLEIRSNAQDKHLKLYLMSFVANK